MAVYKDGDKWRVIYRYTNYKGERKQTQKRGFATKREAVAWEREVMLKSESKLDMTFASFFEIYEEDKKKRVKENTWESKSHVIRTKILPYFGERKIAEIEPKDVIAWQNELLAYKGENGEVYSPTYLKTIHAQLSAIFNHAIRYYHLPSNPAQKAGSMGSEEHKEMLFWTKEEYLKFAEVMMDKPQFARDEQAIKETDRKYGKMCFRVAKNLLFNNEDSEECVNDTYLTVWNKIPPTRPNNFSAFICKITRNLSLKKLELSNAMKRSADAVISLSEIEATMPDNHIAPGIEDEELGKLISTFLWSEKELDRNVFLRKYWFFDTISDIAERYSLPENTVKSMLFRSRNRLREFLKKEGIEV